MSDQIAIPIRHIGELDSPASPVAHSPVTNPSYDVLVPLPGDQQSPYDTVDIPQLLQTPLAIAADREGTITVASILVAPSDVGTDELDTDTDASGIMDSVIDAAQSELAGLVDIANDLVETVSVHGFVAVVDVPESAFSEFTTDDAYDAIFLPQIKTESLHLWEEPIINSVLDTAHCAVYVENIGSERQLVLQDTNDGDGSDAELPAQEIGEILVAVGTGPHSVLGAETARAVAKASGAGVRALHLLTSSDDGPTRQKGRRALSLAEYVLSDLPDFESEIREVESPIDELLSEIENHDIAIVGAPTKSSLLRRLFAGPTPEQVMTQSTTSVVTVQQPSKAMDSVYYRWKRAVERTTKVDITPPEGGVEI